MPKGSKGWPVVIRRWHCRWTFARIGPLFIILFGAVSLLVFLRQGWRSALSGFGVLCGITFVPIACLMLIQNGRTRFTPTSALWVHWLGFSRWVWLSDVRRMRTKTDGVIFDVGRRVTIPLASQPIPHVERQVRQVRKLLDSQYKPLVLTQDRRGAYLVLGCVLAWMISLSLTTRLLKGAGAIALLPPAMVAYLQPLLAWRGVVIMLSVSVLVVLNGFIAAAIAVVGWSVLVIMDWSNPLMNTRWRPRRADWSGFEVQAIEPHDTTGGPGAAVGR